jgi:N-acetylmuramoyl-L-alanine amidase
MLIFLFPYTQTQVEIEKQKGLSVFSLSNKASDKEAEMLAKRENNVDNILGNKNIINDPLIYGSLIKMFQREAMNESSFLARKILMNLEKTKLTVNRGHRFAGFAVLKSYDIPFNTCRNRFFI